MRALSGLLLASAAAAPARAAYWYEEIKHQGIAPWTDEKNYTVFRNVRDFGAKGDGGESRALAILRDRTRLTRPSDGRYERHQQGHPLRETLQCRHELRGHDDEAGRGVFPCRVSSRLRRGGGPC